MWRLAGNTAINNAINPHAARRIVAGISNITPSTISTTPLTDTSISGHGRYGGTIDTKKSPFVKWVTPARTKNAANNTRTMTVKVLILARLVRNASSNDLCQSSG